MQRGLSIPAHSCHHTRPPEVRPQKVRLELNLPIQPFVLAVERRLKLHTALVTPPHLLPCFRFQSLEKVLPPAFPLLLVGNTSAFAVSRFCVQLSGRFVPQLPLLAGFCACDQKFCPTVESFSTSFQTTGLQEPSILTRRPVSLKFLMVFSIGA